MDTVDQEDLFFDFEEELMGFSSPSASTLNPLGVMNLGQLTGPSESTSKGDDGATITGDPTDKDFEPRLAAVRAALEQGLKPDPRLRTVVCRHWLKNLCQKGEQCEFLHQYDLQRMPICRWGASCTIKDCPFRHVTEDNKPECVFYKQGFCLHGPSCKYRHVKKSPQECPEKADFSLTISTNQKMEEEEEESTSKRRKTAPPNEYYKISLCKHWTQNGECPFGEECHFAHGEAELRPFPSADNHLHDELQGEGVQSEEIVKAALSDPSLNLPIRYEEKCKFFVIKSLNYRNLAISVKRGVWATRKTNQAVLNRAFKESDRVIFIFSVNESKHFQGCAFMTEPIRSGHGMQWTSEFGVNWLRTCELPFRAVAQLRNPMNNDLPVIRSRDCQELPRTVGVKLMALVYRQPEVSLADARIEGSLDLPMINVGPGRSPNLTENSVGPAAGINFPISSGSSFMFGCNQHTINECFQRMLFGLPLNMERMAREVVRAGTTLFLFDMTTKMIFGIFEAVTPITLNIEPTAWVRNPRTQECPFPVQVRVRVVLEAPALKESDHAVRTIMSQRKLRIGPLSHDQAQRIANLIASKVGVLNPSREPYEEGGGNPAGWYSPKSRFVERINLQGSVNDPMSTEKLIGPQGIKVDQIIAECGGKVEIILRGQGSGFLEGPYNEEASEPLHFLISTDDEASFQLAVNLVQDLIERYHSPTLYRLSEGAPDHDLWSYSASLNMDPSTTNLSLRSNDQGLNREDPFAPDMAPSSFYPMQRNYFF